MYELDVPGHERHDLERTLHTICTLPAHEQIAADTEADVGLRVRLREQLASRDLPAVYWEHPVVLAAGGQDVAPIAVYIDAVPYSHTDSVLGVR